MRSIILTLLLMAGCTSYGPMSGMPVAGEAYRALSTDTYGYRETKRLLAQNWEPGALIAGPDHLSFAMWNGRRYLTLWTIEEDNLESIEVDRLGAAPTAYVAILIDGGFRTFALPHDDAESIPLISRHLAGSGSRSPRPSSDP